MYRMHAGIELAASNRVLPFHHRHIVSIRDFDGDVISFTAAYSPPKDIPW
jgi:hypothetical protein